MTSTHCTAGLLFLFGVLLFGSACAHRIDPRPAAAPAGAFSHATLDALQQRHVDASGRVDYAGLAADRAELDAYYRQLAAQSPRSHPERFPTRAEELAYWINAYNATVWIAVLEAGPIDSVGDVAAPLVLRPFLFGTARYAGFFYFQDIVLGGEAMNLYDLENQIIRAYGEPRIHFAINCASIGCPRLPMEAFLPSKLEAQLEREARRFFADPTKFRIDHDARVVHVSSILDWFAEDFGADLASYVRPLLDAEAQAELDRAADYEWHFLEYDWGLNRQSAAVSAAPPRTSSAAGPSSSDAPTTRS